MKDDIIFYVMIKFFFCVVYLKKVCIELKICCNELNINVMK